MDEWSLRLSTRAQVDAMEEMISGHWPEARAFREKWLPDGEPFGDRREAREWLERETQKTNDLRSPPAESVEVARFMAGYMPEAIQYRDDPTPPLLDSKGLRNMVEIGFHFDDQDFLPFVAQVRPYGFFADVLRVADSFVTSEGWTEHSARAWLITDHARPVVRAVTIKDPTLIRHRKLARVTIDVALDTPPHVLASEFAAVRSREEQRYHWPLTAKKPMAPWSLALVAFVVTRNDGRGWAEIVDEWNRLQAKDWRFANADLCGRSAKKAYRTLMGRELNWHGPRGAASHRR